MKYLDQSSLPKDLRDARFGMVEKKATEGWLDRSKLPPLPVDDGWIDADTALSLIHDTPELRAVLKHHSQADALDNFCYEFCRQVPMESSALARYRMWQVIAMELGGPKTADLIAATMVARRVEIIYLNYAAYALAQIGSRTHLPALTLGMLRIGPGYNRDLIQQRMTALAQRLKLSQAEFDDWALPDHGDAAEVAAFQPKQPARLEQAMLTGRRWDVEAFDRRLVHQPIMAPLAAGLVWGYFDTSGKLMEAFVIADGKYPAAPSGASVGIVHPAHFSREAAGEWKERARHLKPPFAQWNRPAHHLDEEEIAAGRIAPPPGKVPAAALLCRLESAGWERPKTRTLLEFHTRPFAELGVTAVIRYSGIPLTYGEEWSEQTVESCTFVAGEQPLPLEQVSPLAISAVLGDLNTLVGGDRKREARSK